MEKRVDRSKLKTVHRKKGKTLDGYEGRVKRDIRFQDKMRSIGYRMGPLCKDLVMWSLGLLSVTKKC